MNPSSERINTLVIGAGQAGLAMSRCLSDRGIEHVVLERGRIGERWRSERWDSLRLLTPNWQTRLPAFAYHGPDADGFMSMPEVVAFFEGYARSFAAPVESGTTVTSLERCAAGFRVETSRGRWLADAVVIATGYSDVPYVPSLAARLATGIDQVTPSAYKSPAQLRDAGVLVVGASATGIQLAQEIHESGRPVLLAVGRHTRVPRRYRGRDILWWLDRMGIFDDSADAVYDIEISREQASLQLVGRADHASIDLRQLASQGVRVVGRLVSASGHDVRFDDDLVATTAAADVKLATLLRRIDRFADQSGPDGWPVPAAAEFEPLCRGFAAAGSTVDLRAANIHTVVWATGYRRDYGWLRVPGALDTRGEIQHRAGVTAVAGLYAIGLQFQSRRNSSFIDGVGHDARALSAHLAGYLSRGDRQDARAS